ncbi:MAG: SH3 domain-containing protein [Alkalilacustris sp.]
MRLTLLSALIALALLTGCAAPPLGDRAVVQGAGNELLKLRAGPGLGYRIILGLPDGTVVSRRGCVTEVGQRWCRVSLDMAPGVVGFVSDDYLSVR